MVSLCFWRGCGDADAPSWGNGIDREEPIMSPSNQGGHSVASVNTGAGSHICMEELAVFHTRFWVSSGACGLMVLVTYEFLAFSIHV